jgi:hypothetical protein
MLMAAGKWSLKRASDNQGCPSRGLAFFPSTSSPDVDGIVSVRSDESSCR